MLVSQKGAPRKHQGNVAFIKDSGAGGGGSWIFTENKKILESCENAEMLEIYKNTWESQEIAESRETEIWKMGNPKENPWKITGFK